MSQALTYLYEIYTSFLDLVFNRFELFTNVTIGWIIVSIVIFGLMINNILNLPKGVHTVSTKEGMKFKR